MALHLNEKNTPFKVPQSDLVGPRLHPDLIPNLLLSLSRSKTKV